MPYIPATDRDAFDAALEALPRPNTAGELNYVLTKVCLKFLGDQPRYQNLNDAMGALNCAGHELYRRVVAPYEDLKIAENGDAY